jgi:hypothetical protein
MTADGLCAAHGGIVDMTAIGKAGGLQSVRSRLGLDPELADGRIRRKAKARLEALLASEDEAKALTAARSLYSYSPSKAPADEDDPPAADTVSALKVILRRLAEMPERELVHLLDEECFKLLGRVAKHDRELMLAAERFTERLAELTGRRGAQTLGVPLRQHPHRWEARAVDYTPPPEAETSESRSSETPARRPIPLTGRVRKQYPRSARRPPRVSRPPAHDAAVNCPAIHPSRLLGRGWVCRRSPQAPRRAGA